MTNNKINIFVTFIMLVSALYSMKFGKLQNQANQVLSTREIKEKLRMTIGNNLGYSTLPMPLINEGSAAQDLFKDLKAIAKRNTQPNSQETNQSSSLKKEGGSQSKQTEKSVSISQIPQSLNNSSISSLNSSAEQSISSHKINLDKYTTIFKNIADNEEIKETYGRSMNYSNLLTYLRLSSYLFSTAYTNENLTDSIIQSINVYLNFIGNLSTVTKQEKDFVNMFYYGDPMMHFELISNLDSVQKSTALLKQDYSQDQAATKLFEMIDSVVILLSLS